MTREEIQDKVALIITKITESSAEHERDMRGEPDKAIELDSLNILKLIVELENEFDIEFDDEDFNAEVLRSLASITDYISEKI
jgi:acyl carrier protein